jgi:hypothetical protein
MRMVRSPGNVSAMAFGVDAATDKAAAEPEMRTVRRLIMVVPQMLNADAEHVPFRYRLKILFSFFIIAFSNRRRA